MSRRKGGNTWFTSDQHFGHLLMSQLRGFGDDIEAHDEALANAWEDAVDEEDTVWVLGDIALARWRTAIDLLYDLPGHKHLIAGNHDMCHPMHRKYHKYSRAYLRGFETVQPFAHIKIAKRDVMLSHFPYAGDHTEEDRFLQYRLPDVGSFLLHGHTHSEKKVTSPREIHVGVDAWDLKPVPLQTIELLLYQTERDQLRATGLESATIS